MDRKRVQRALRRRVDMLRHRGTTVLCPVCGGRWDRFKDDWNRRAALCWSCGSHERHRVQWLIFEQRAELLRSASAMLHFAPEYCLRRRLQDAAARDGFRYVTGDLNPAGVDLRLDLLALDLPDDAFDAVLCSHVLEHVDDDARAIAELRRITAPGGWCIVMVPLDLGRSETYEDASVTSPQARVKAFWQHDHLRLYAPDIEDRLAAAGFRVEVIRPLDAFSPEVVRRCGLLAVDWIFVCR